MAVRELSEGHQGAARGSVGGDDPMAEVRPFLDTLVRLINDDRPAADWPAARCQLAPLVAVAEADLAPAGRRRLRARLATLEAHPSLRALMLGFALRGELPLNDDDAVRPPSVATVAALARLTALLDEPRPSTPAETRARAPVHDSTPPALGIMLRSEATPPLAGTPKHLVARRQDFGTPDVAEKNSRGCYAGATKHAGMSALWHRSTLAWAALVPPVPDGVCAHATRATPAGPPRGGPGAAAAPRGPVRVVPAAVPGAPQRPALRLQLLRIRQRRSPAVARPHQRLPGARPVRGGAVTKRDPQGNEPPSTYPSQFVTVGRRR
jgi:hypothetical protein